MTLQVAYLGSNNLFSRFVTAFLRQFPSIQRLNVYGCNDAEVLSEYLGGTCEVHQYHNKEHLPTALENADIVVIGDESESVEPSRECVLSIASKVFDYAYITASVAPKAMVVVSASPLNLMVPLTGHVLQELGCFDGRKLLGVTSEETLRANPLFAELIGVDEAVLPVVGGASPQTRIPLFSQARPNVKLKEEDKHRLINDIKSFDLSFPREEIVAERAYATIRLLRSLIRGLENGNEPVNEMAMTKTSLIADTMYFSLPVELGQTGVQRAFGLPTLTGIEEELLEYAVVNLNHDLTRSFDLFKGLKTNLEAVPCHSLIGKKKINENVQDRPTDAAKNVNINEAFVGQHKSGSAAINSERIKEKKDENVKDDFNEVTADVESKLSCEDEKQPIQLYNASRGETSCLEGYEDLTVNSHKEAGKEYDHNQILSHHEKFAQVTESPLPHKESKDDNIRKSASLSCASTKCSHLYHTTVKTPEQLVSGNKEMNKKDGTNSPRDKLAQESNREGEKSCLGCDETTNRQEKENHANETTANIFIGTKESTGAKENGNISGKTTGHETEGQLAIQKPENVEATGLKAISTDKHANSGVDETALEKSTEFSREPNLMGNENVKKESINDSELEDINASIDAEIMNMDNHEIEAAEELSKLKIVHCPAPSIVESKLIDEIIALGVDTSCTLSNESQKIIEKENIDTSSQAGKINSQDPVKIKQNADSENQLKTREEKASSGLNQTTNKINLLANEVKVENPNPNEGCKVKVTNDEIHRYAPSFDKSYNPHNNLNINSAANNLPLNPLEKMISNIKLVEYSVNQGFKCKEKLNSKNKADCQYSIKKDNKNHIVPRRDAIKNVLHNRDSNDTNTKSKNVDNNVNKIILNRVENDEGKVHLSKTKFEYQKTDTECLESEEGQSKVGRISSKKETISRQDCEDKKGTINGWDSVDKKKHLYRNVSDMLSVKGNSTNAHKEHQSLLEINRNRETKIKERQVKLKTIISNIAPGNSRPPTAKDSKSRTAKNILRNVEKINNEKKINSIPKKIKLNQFEKMVQLPYYKTIAKTETNTMDKVNVNNLDQSSKMKLDYRTKDQMIKCGAVKADKNTSTRQSGKTKGSTDISNEAGGEPTGRTRGNENALATLNLTRSNDSKTSYRPIDSLQSKNEGIAIPRTKGNTRNRVNDLSRTELIKKETEPVKIPSNESKETNLEKNQKTKSPIHSSVSITNPSSPKIGISQQKNCETDVGKMDVFMKPHQSELKQDRMGARKEETFGQGKSEIPTEVNVKSTETGQDKGKETPNYCTVTGKNSKISVVQENISQTRHQEDKTSSFAETVFHENHPQNINLISNQTNASFSPGNKRNTSTLPMPLNESNFPQEGELHSKQDRLFVRNVKPDKTTEVLNHSQQMKSISELEKNIQGKGSTIVKSKSEVTNIKNTETRDYNASKYKEQGSHILSDVKNKEKKYDNNTSKYGFDDKTITKEKTEVNFNQSKPSGNILNFKPLKLSRKALKPHNSENTLEKVNLNEVSENNSISIDTKKIDDSFTMKNLNPDVNGSTAKAVRYNINTKGKPEEFSKRYTVLKNGGVSTMIKEDINVENCKAKVLQQTRKKQNTNSKSSDLSHRKRRSYESELGKVENTIKMRKGQSMVIFDRISKKSSPPKNSEKILGIRGSHNFSLNSTSPKNKIEKLGEVNLPNKEQIALAMEESSRKMKRRLSMAKMMHEKAKVKLQPTDVKHYYGRDTKNISSLKHKRTALPSQIASNIELGVSGKSERTNRNLKVKSYNKKALHASAKIRSNKKSSLDNSISASVQTDIANKAFKNQKISGSEVTKTQDKSTEIKSLNVKGQVEKLNSPIINKSLTKTDEQKVILEENSSTKELKTARGSSLKENLQSIAHEKDTPPIKDNSKKVILDNLTKKNTEGTEKKLLSKIACNAANEAKSNPLQTQVVTHKPVALTKITGDLVKVNNFVNENKKPGSAGNLMSEGSSKQKSVKYSADKEKTVKNKTMKSLLKFPISVIPKKLSQHTLFESRPNKSANLQGKANATQSSIQPVHNHLRWSPTSLKKSQGTSRLNNESTGPGHSIALRKNPFNFGTIKMTAELFREYMLNNRISINRLKPKENEKKLIPQKYLLEAPKTDKIKLNTKREEQSIVKQQSKKKFSVEEHKYPLKVMKLQGKKDQESFLIKNVYGNSISDKNSKQRAIQNKNTSSQIRKTYTDFNKKQTIMDALLRRDDKKAVQEDSLYNYPKSVTLNTKRVKTVYTAHSSNFLGQSPGRIMTPFALEREQTQMKKIHLLNANKTKAFPNKERQGKYRSEPNVLTGNKNDFKLGTSQLKPLTLGRGKSSSPGKNFSQSKAHQNHEQSTLQVVKYRPLSVETTGHQGSLSPDPPVNPLKKHLTRIFNMFQSVISNESK